MKKFRAVERPAPLGWVLALTALGATVVALDQLVVATALQTIHHDLNASMAGLEWTVNAFSLSFAALLIPAAGLGDRIGRKRTYLIGLTLFGLASAACALAPNAGLLILARVLQGVGSALITPASLALLTAATPPARRGAVNGIYAAAMGLAVVGGPVIGGAVTEGLAWQWIFWINVPVIALLLPLAAGRLTELKGAPERPDLPGIALAALSMFAIVWALIRSGPAGWTSIEVLSVGLGGLLLLAAFVVRERRTPRPMLPLRMFTAPAFAAGNASALLLTASLFSTVFFLAQYLQLGLGHSPLGAGLRFLPWTVPLFVVAPVAGRLLNRVGSRLLISTGLLLQGIGMLWIALNAQQGHGYSASVAALVLSGIGTAMAMPAQQSAVMSAVDPAGMGKAAGIFNAMRQLGGALGIAVLAAVFAAHGSDASPQSFTDGFAAAMVGTGVIALLGALVGLLAPGRRPAGDRHHEPADGARGALPTPDPAPEAADVH